MKLQKRVVYVPVEGKEDVDWVGAAVGGTFIVLGIGGWIYTGDWRVAVATIFIYGFIAAMFSGVFGGGHR